MLKLLDYDSSALKDELKQARVLKIISVAELKRKYRNQPIGSFNARALNDRKKRLYSAKTLPARVGNIIIDFKLYRLFMKKLKAFSTEISILENTLVIKYWKFGTVNKGKLVLNDLSSYFQDFQHIPVAELVNG